MVANKHTPKIIIAVMVVAVVLCFVAIASSEKLTELLGGTGIKMEYESKLFNTDEPISVDIQMDEDEWNDMLSNAMAEEYYVCDVVVNGQRVNNVAIRPKGNTSLSAIAMDPDSNRYSLKLEFDHFMDGQTCYGLDKLILNNNYADATNMKEAIIYDMYQYIGAVASLYNYAEVSVNGEYLGVYLALEGVEQSFMLRNYGTKDGELYKPDTMEMGGGDSSSSSAARPNASAPGSDSSGFKGKTPPSGSGGFSGGSGFGNKESSSDAGEANAGGSETDSKTESEDYVGSGSISGGFSFDPDNMPEGFDAGDMPEGFDPNNTPEGFDPGNMPDGFNPDNMPGGFDSGSGTAGDTGSSSSISPDSSSETGDSSGSTSETGGRSGSGKSRPSGMGGFSMGNGGANLNYTDDDLDSYSTIWDAEITSTGKADHRRVVTALKNISEGTDLEKYLDVDNVLKYMAVHTFAVNMDSLSGNMSHNYYLYEYEGQLNIFPWDYNLSFGGMSMGGSDATSMVNDAIDTPFSGTQFFDALLENEEYRERYHSYLRQLVDEYVNGGRFDEVYNRIRNQIDPLVETDPTAFYSYDEYQVAAPMLYETIKLRAESIEGQIDGTIPSTDDGQREDTSNLVDASAIDVSAMGQFSMGGGFAGFGGGRGRSSKTGSSDSATEEDTSSKEGTSTGGDESSESGTEAPDISSDGAASNPFGAGFSEKPSDSGNSFANGQMPGGFSPPGAAGSTGTWMKNLVTYGVCLVIMVAALIIVKCFKRRR